MDSQKAAFRKLLGLSPDKELGRERVKCCPVGHRKQGKRPEEKPWSLEARGKAKFPLRDPTGRVEGES